MAEQTLELATLPEWVSALEGTPAFGVAPEYYDEIILTPGLPDWVLELVGTPAFGIATEVPPYDPNAPDAVPPVVGYVPPTGANAPVGVPARPSGPVPGQSPFPTVPVIPGAAAGIPLTPVPPSPGPNGGVVGQVIGDVARRVVGKAAELLDDVGAAVAPIVSRLTGIVGDILDKAIPTISELAMGVASAASGALSFLADNLTDAADLGLQLAQGIATPFELLLEAGGDMLLGGLTKLIQAIAAAFQYVSSLVMRDPGLVRLV